VFLLHLCTLLENKSIFNPYAKATCLDFVSRVNFSIGSQSLIDTSSFIPLAGVFTNYEATYREKLLTKRQHDLKVVSNENEGGW